MWWTSLRAERTEPLYYLPSYTAAPTLNLTLRLSLTLTLLLQMPRTLNYTRATRHPNCLRSPFCTKTRSNTAHQQLHNKSYKWSLGFNVNGRTALSRSVQAYRMAYIHHIAAQTAHMYARRRIQFPRTCVIHLRPWLGPQDGRVGSAPPHPTPPARLSRSE